MLTKANLINDLLSYLHPAKNDIKRCAALHIFLFIRILIQWSLSLFQLHPKCWKVLAFYSKIVANYWDAAIQNQKTWFITTLTTPTSLYRSTVSFSFIMPLNIFPGML